MLPVSAGPEDDDRENYCRVHRGETIKYYCETCNSPVCLPCTFLDHKAHQIEEIKNVRNTFSQVQQFKVKTMIPFLSCLVKL